MSKREIKKFAIKVVIPAFNEEKHIFKVVNAVKEKGFNVLVIDDGSSDNTSSEAKNAGAEVLRLSRNQGKGKALRIGFDNAFKNTKYVITLDGDDQHDVNDIGSFVEKLSWGYDVVVSRRNLKEMPFLSKSGNWILTRLARIFFGVKVHDTQSGFRAFSKKGYQKTRWKSYDYAMESESVAKIGLNKVKYCEVPIRTIYPKKTKGTNWFDGFKIFFKTIYWRMFPGTLVRK
ncbi:dolichyl-phosphate mannose synthase [Candidatus Woesearchaeota archaeon CG10_big_fil_rev_8_21_14_0_10_37_12]|nr:MAG: dolichyl-phosphate mannose synthase [Candidatus Woesearchaeota archaeon CG10_big_fil_rev_8_21_14_0_10_37_12]